MVNTIHPIRGCRCAIYGRFMASERHIPGNGAAAAHRPELYGQLRKRNERRARVAAMLEERRERKLRVDQVVQLHRERRFRQEG
jgi:hypothetical protein